MMSVSSSDKTIFKCGYGICEQKFKDPMLLEVHCLVEHTRAHLEAQPGTAERIARQRSARPPAGPRARRLPANHSRPAAGEQDAATATPSKLRPPIPNRKGMECEKQVLARVRQSVRAANTKVISPYSSSAINSLADIHDEDVSCSKKRVALAPTHVILKNRQSILTHHHIQQSKSPLNHTPVPTPISRLAKKSDISKLTKLSESVECGNNAKRIVRKRAGSSLRSDPQTQTSSQTVALRNSQSGNMFVQPVPGSELTGQVREQPDRKVAMARLSAESAVSFERSLHTVERGQRHPSHKRRGLLPLPVNCGQHANRALCRLDLACITDVCVWDSPACVGFACVNMHETCGHDTTDKPCSVQFCPFEHVSYCRLCRVKAYDQYKKLLNEPEHKMHVNDQTHEQHAFWLRAVRTRCGQLMLDGPSALPLHIGMSDSNGTQADMHMAVAQTHTRSRTPYICDRHVLRTPCKKFESIADCKYQKKCRLEHPLCTKHLTTGVQCDEWSCALEHTHYCRQCYYFKYRRVLDTLYQTQSYNTTCNTQRLQPST